LRRSYQIILVPWNNYQSNNFYYNIINSFRAKQDINKSYLESKIKENAFKQEILLGINQEIERNNQIIYDGIISKQFVVKNVFILFFNLKEKISIDELINKNINKIHNKENLIEENIRFHKIKDIKDNKDNIENKIKSLEENIKILENNDLTRIDLNISVSGGKEIIEDNIRKSRIKEIKNKKEILEKKLYYLDEQVQSLMKEEESNNINKKFNLKQYLDNFEKDKKEADQREQRWKKEHEKRVKAFEEQQKKIQEQLKEKVDNENLSLNLKRQENYLKKLEQIKYNAKKHRDDVMKLSEMKEEWKNKPISDKQYLFKIAEEEFKKKQQQIQEEETKRLDLEKAKIKQIYKPISRVEIDEFKKNYEEQREKLIYEREKERLLKKEELIQRNSALPKIETHVHHKIIEEEKKLRETKEKEKMDKIYTKLKIKQFSKVIQTSMVPKIDETKKKEIEERILAEGQRPKKLENKRIGRIILKKHDPSNPKKYNWELKLNSSSLSDRGNILRANNNSISKGVFSTSILNKSRPFTREDKLRSSKSRSREKKKPLEKNPDYLTEMRIKKNTLEKTASNTNPQLGPSKLFKLLI